MFPGANLSGSKKTLSIPVNQIEPQSLHQGHVGQPVAGLRLEPQQGRSPSAVDFTNTCSVSGRTSANVAITVSWTRVAADPSVITIFTHVYATNPSARLITTTVTDRIYAGSTQATQVTPTQSAGSLTGSDRHRRRAGRPDGARSSTSLGRCPPVRQRASTMSRPVRIRTTVTAERSRKPRRASASATVSTTTAATTTATISDTESVSSGFHFKVTSMSGTSGTFAGGYTLNTSTTGPVVWNSPAL